MLSTYLCNFGYIVERLRRCEQLLLLIIFLNAVTLCTTAETTDSLKIGIKKIKQPSSIEAERKLSVKYEEQEHHRTSLKKNRPRLECPCPTSDEYITQIKDMKGKEAKLMKTIED